MSLHDITQKIKNLRFSHESEIIEFNESGEIEHFPLIRKLFFSVVIILIAALSFGIGRLSVVGKREPIRIEYDPEIFNQASVSNAFDNIENSLKTENSKIENSTSVVVSKNGSKYHYPHCAGAKQIKEENKIVFSTPVAAEAAGYTLAANCSPP